MTSKDVRGAGIGCVGGKQRPGNGGDDDRGGIVPATGECGGDRRFPPTIPPSPPRDRLLWGGGAPGGPAPRQGAGLKRGNQGCVSNHPKVPSRHILDLIPPRVSASRLSPLSLTLSLWTVRTSPPLILPRLILRLFSTLRFQDPGTVPRPPRVPLPTKIPPASARTTTTMMTITLGGGRGIVAIIRGPTITATAPSVSGTG